MTDWLSRVTERPTLTKSIAFCSRDRLGNLSIILGSGQRGSRKPLRGSERRGVLRGPSGSVRVSEVGRWLSFAQCFPQEQGFGGSHSSHEPLEIL